MKELFLVEGVSAASTLQQAMHKPSQSVLAVQGKLINVEKASPKKVLANQTCQKIFQALNCGIKKECDPKQLSFSRILILTDPDIDGVHARVLLLALFNHYLKALIDSNYVSVIIPPLYRITYIDSTSTKTQYAWNEQQRIQLLDKTPKLKTAEITRYKGVAQFSGEECKQLLLHPETRKQINLVTTQ